MVSDSATSTQVRDELESLLVRDLHGPWDGSEEELPPGVPPSERYLLGRLVPRTPPPPPRADDAAEDSEAPRDPELVDLETLSTDDSGDTEVEPEATVRSGSRAASLDRSVLPGARRCARSRRTRDVGSVRQDPVRAARDPDRAPEPGMEADACRRRSRDTA